MAELEGRDVGAGVDLVGGVHVAWVGAVGLRILDLERRTKPVVSEREGEGLVLVCVVRVRKIGAGSAGGLDLPRSRESSRAVRRSHQRSVGGSLASTA